MHLAQPRDKNTLKTEEFTHALVVQGSKEPNLKKSVVSEMALTELKYH